MNRSIFHHQILAVAAAALVVTLAGVAHAGAELCPALVAHAWHGQRHVMGVVSVTDAGELRFAGLYSEETAEIDHPGYWLEEWKVEKLREIFPSLSITFRFGEQITVDGVDYLRVLPAKRSDGPPSGKPTSTTSLVPALRAKPIIIA